MSNEQNSRTGYTLPKGAAPVPQLAQAVMYRSPDDGTREALRDALADSSMSATQLVDSMVKHCLREAGYLHV